MSGEPDRLRAVFAGVQRLREDVERLGCSVAVRTSIVLELDDAEGLGRIDASWVEALDKAAIEIAGDTRRGMFIRRLAEAWLAADEESKDILSSAWQRLVSRESLGRFME